MAQQKNSENQSKPRSKGGIVVIILLLFLIAGAGWLYYSIAKAPLDLDDPQALAASAPMDVEERFRFTGDGSVQVKLDKADIWSLILAHTGEDLLDVLNQELSDYGLSVSGCAIRLGEAGLRLDLELYYGENRLVIKVPCDLQISGRTLLLQPTGVKLGIISLPVGSLLSKVKLEYDLDLPVISDVKQLHFLPDSICLTGSVMLDIRNQVSMDEKLCQAAVFSETFRSLANALQTQAGIDKILAHLEQNPGSVEELYRQLFILAGDKYTSAYLESRHGMTQRFLPGIDFSGLEEEQTAFDQELREKNLVLEQFFTNLVNDYNDKKFTLSDGTFILNWKPFDVVTYAAGKYDSLLEILNPESMFLILVDAEDGFIRKTSSFYRMADGNQQFTQEVDYNRTYILGCVLRSVDGEPFLMYESEVQNNNTYSRIIKLLPITEETVSQLQQAGKFGVWTNRK